MSSPDSPPPGTLRRALRLLRVDTRQVALAVLLGTLGLGSAVALTAVSGWLIARASQMPPVLVLSIATVGVRTFGIAKGVLRYLERLVSHDVALRGMTTLRTTLYAALAEGDAERLLSLRRGDLLARIGADVDAVGDVVVRGLLPGAVALTLGLGTAGAMAFFWPPAAVALIVGLLLAGALAPWLTALGSRTAERRATAARARMTAVALGALDDAGPLTVSGRAPQELDALRAADLEIAAAVDAGAGPTALGAGLGALGQGFAALVALVTGIPAVRSGALAPVELAVVVLTPLAAFEATAMLPSAAVQVHRSRAAAARILTLLDGTGAARLAVAEAAATVATPRPKAEAPLPALGVAHVVDSGLVAHGLSCGWSGRPPVLTGIDLQVRTGRSVAVVGPSGAGKTTLLLTLAGLLPARAGRVEIVDPGPRDLATLSRDEVTATVVATAEDAHVFGTTVLENLRVARGSVTPDEARAGLARVGLGGWLTSLPDGLDTAIGPDARTLSGGERRRLLLARALLSPAPLLLLDEPAEHLDLAGADGLMADLLRPGPDRGILVVTHRVSSLAAADEVVWLHGGVVAARGRHEDLLERVPGYRAALDAERRRDAVQRGS